MKSKVLILIMAGIMAMTCFAGCNNDPRDENGSDRFGWGLVVPERVTDDAGAAVSVRDDGAYLVQNTLSETAMFADTDNRKEGIHPNTGEDVSSQIQAVLNKLYKERGGGSLFLEKGVYILAKQIVVPENTRLNGEWCEPGEDTIGEGTILHITAGKGNDSSASADAAILLNAASVVSDITVYYPEQTYTGTVPFPYTFANGGYYGINIANVTILNAYRGISVSTHNYVTLEKVYITAFRTGVYMSGLLDIGRLMDVHISSDYLCWFRSSADTESIRSSVKANATGFLLGRLDWVYCNNCSVDGANIAVNLFQQTETSTTGSLNGQIYNFKIDRCRYGYYVDMENTVGVQITNSSVHTDEQDGAAVLITEKVVTTGLFFNSCTFASAGKILYGRGTGITSITDSSFSAWGEGEYALYAAAGSYILDSCEFADGGKDIYLNGETGGVSVAKVINCTFAGSKEIYNQNLRASAYTEKNEEYSAQVAPLEPEYYELEEPRRAGTEDVFYASDYGAKADATLSDTAGTDNTEAIQRALNAAEANGGGYVVLDNGYYYVMNQLVIPSGVVLRGGNVADHHFGVGTRGTVLVTDFGKNMDEYAFMTLLVDAGIENMSIFYPDQNFDETSEYAPTVYMEGDNSFLYNVTMPNAYRMVYIDAENCHVRFLRGLGLDTAVYAVGANGLLFEHFMLTVGDWQDGARTKNAPSSDAWKSHPNRENYGIILADSDDATFYECFLFGFGQGVTLKGEVNDFMALGFGVDASRDGISLENSGTGNVFIGTELVGVDSNINTKSSYTGTTNFYNTACWYGGYAIDSVFDGAGTVNIQQYKAMNGGFKVNSGTVNIQNAILDGNSSHLSFSSSARGGVINSVGSQGSFNLDSYPTELFIVENCTRR